jgi:hypothetical protein
LDLYSKYYAIFWICTPNFTPKLGLEVLILRHYVGETFQNIHRLDGFNWE